VKAWPSDPLVFLGLDAEVSEKLPQGSLAGGDQAFKASSLVDASVSARPSIVPQSRLSVGLFIHQ